MNENEDDWFLDDPDHDEFERKQKRRKNMPIYQKAMDIAKTVRLLGSTLEGDDKEMYEYHLNESAMIMAAKLGGAIGSGSWLLSMQNASIVRSHAEWMLTATSGLKHMTKADRDYVKVLRTDMEEFRELFNEWVKEIHKMDKDDFEDEWGLFVR
jgi:hypothetical protein